MNIESEKKRAELGVDFTTGTMDEDTKFPLPQYQENYKKKKKRIWVNG
jgi:hypothetical protein